MSTLTPIPGFGWALLMIVLSALIQAQWPARWWAQVLLIAAVFALKWWDVYGPYPGDKQGRNADRHYKLSAQRSRLERFFLG